MRRARPAHPATRAESSTNRGWQANQPASTPGYGRGGEHDEWRRPRPRRLAEQAEADRPQAGQPVADALDEARHGRGGLRGPRPVVDERHAERERAHADAQRAHPQHGAVERRGGQADVAEDQDDRARHDDHERVAHPGRDLRDHQGCEHSPGRVEADHRPAERRTATGVGEHRRHPRDDAVVGQRHHREEDHQPPDRRRPTDPEPVGGRRGDGRHVVVGGQLDREHAPDHRSHRGRDCPDPHRDPPARCLGDGHGQEGCHELTGLHQQQVRRGPQGDAIGEPRLDERHEHDVGGADARQRQDGRRDQRGGRRGERPQHEGECREAEGSGGGALEPVPPRHDRGQEAEDGERRRRHRAQQAGEGQSEPQVRTDDLQQRRDARDRGPQVQRRQGDREPGPQREASAGGRS